jgi:fermentation-respiration switch protein FrsA (DUF1100 family)
LRDHIAATSTDQTRSRLVAAAVGHGQQGAGPRYMTGGFTLGTTNLFQYVAFLFRERTKRILLTATHHLTPGQLDLSPAAQEHITKEVKWQGS